MPKVRDIQNNFTSGFVDAELVGRIDIEQYNNGLKQATNVMTLPQGPIKRRLGTLFVDELPEILTFNTSAPTMPNGGVAANIHDNDLATSGTTTVNISTTNFYVVAQYDLGAELDIAFVDVIGIKFTAAATSQEFRIEYSNSALGPWTTLKAITNLTEVPQDIRAVGVTARFFRIVRIGTTDYGTNKIELVEFLIWDRGAISDVRLFNLELTDTDAYVLAFTAGNLRIYKDGAFLIDLGTSYADADINSLQFAQADTAGVVVQENYAPKRLVKGTTDLDWSLTDISFINVTEFDYNDSLSPAPTSYIATLSFVSFTEGDRFQIDIDGALTSSISYTTVGATLQANITREVQKLYLLGETGVSTTWSSPVATITLAGSSAGAFEAPVAYPTSSANAAAVINSVRTQIGVSRREDLWGPNRGYPKTVTFYQSRMYFGGTKSKPQSILGSKSGQFFDFDTNEGFDDDAIFVTINTRTRNSISAIIPSRLLQVFTTGGEFAVSQVPITPATVTPQTQTNHGTSTVNPVEIDGSTLFIERKGRTLREFLFNLQEQAFLGSSLSFLAQSLINVPIDMTALRGRALDDSNYVFIVNTDGTMAVYNVLRSQGIGAFTKWTTNGLITAVSVADDVFYMATTRNGKNLLERMDTSVLTDCALVTTQASTATITGLDHLEGFEVRVKLDGSVMNTQTVSGGSITMERAGLGVNQTTEVGLNYIPIIQPMPLATFTKQGSSQMDIKKIIETKLSVIDTLGLTVSINGEDPQVLPDRAFGNAANSPLGTNPTPFTGIIPRLMESLGYSEDRLQSMIITQTDPLPMTIVSIATKLETT